jgi:ribonuclease J
LHKDLAIAMGEQERNILLPQIGDIIEVNNRGIKKAGIIPAGQRLVDGLGLGDPESIVLRDRKQLSEDGVAVVVLGMNGRTGEITSGPDIISRGLVYANEDALIKEAKQVIVDSINGAPEKQTDWSIVKNDVRRVLGNFFFRKTKRRPMILTIVIEN